MSQYRIVISQTESGQFLAKVPELSGCDAQAATAAEALTLVNEEISAQLANMKDQGIVPPEPIDAADFNGQLSLQVSTALHRDLAFMAKEDGAELQPWLIEVLGRVAEGGLRHYGRRRSHSGPRDGNTRGNDRGNRGEGMSPRYHGILENRADFIEYVRSLEPARGAAGARPNAGRNNRQGRR